MKICTHENIPTIRYMYMYVHDDVNRHVYLLA